MQTIGAGKNAIFHTVWNTITTARSIHPMLLNPPAAVTHWTHYQTGAVHAMQQGEVITGGTSGATFVLAGYITENGVAGSGDSGILLLQAMPSSTSAPTASGETWTGGKSAGTVVAAQAPVLLVAAPCPAINSALITVETANIVYTLDGSTPQLTAAAAGTNLGHILQSASTTLTQDLPIEGQMNLKNFKAINAVNANGAIMKITLFA